MLKDLAGAPMDDEVKSILIHYANSLEAQEVDPADSLVSIYLLDTTDDLDALEASWGFSPFVNQRSGAHFGTSKFHPYWEHLIEHQYWFEMLCLSGDDGSGCIVFIPKGVGDVELLEMCRIYSQRG